ncbi:MAG: choice-of-anchor Q domain-containing protein, partial [Anaerolineales bacterium]
RGIINSATLNVVNSTFFDNAATTLGGGIYTSYRGTSSISNSTFFKNSAGSLGGGISNRGTLSMYNTIIAGSINGGDCWNNGAVGANVSNLIEDGSCDPAFTGDPMLGPLQNNGGPTPTHALLPGSPAIDNGDDNACTAYDQRDVFRPQDGDGDGNAACDIGAFERING